MDSVCYNFRYIPLIYVALWNSHIWTLRFIKAVIIIIIIIIDATVKGNIDVYRSSSEPDRRIVFIVAS